MNDKLKAIVARRHGLTDDEAAELRGRTLRELASHAQHLLRRRDAVSAAQRRNPAAFAIEVEGHYDGGGVELHDGAGREMAVSALSDAVHGRDRRTTDFLARVARSTFASNRPSCDEDDQARRERITGRLRAAGYEGDQ